jgi:Asp-tRNA(Asn)/Glu-tRNA(Gln) amidotransferase A subunit family amidase
VATPTVPIVAPALAEAERPEVAAALVRHTRLANLTGLPALSLPVAVGPGGLAVGLHLTARNEDRLLEGAATVEVALRTGAAKPARWSRRGRRR